MIPYLLIYATFVVGALFNDDIKRSQHKYLNSALIFSVVTLLIFIAFRVNTGADWDPYLARMENLAGASVQDAWDEDLLYGIINWIGANIYGGIYFVNFFCTCIILYCMHRSLSLLKNKWLGYIVLMQPYFIYIAMNQVRQAVAISILSYLIVCVVKRKSLLSIIMLGIIAVGFHKTSVFFLLILSIYGLLQFKHKIIYIPFFCVFVFLIYTVFWEYIGNRFEFYEAYPLDSGGSFFLLRVLMIAVAVTLLLTRATYYFPSASIIVYLCYSYVVILILLMLMPTGIIFIERLASYWTPFLAYAFASLGHGLNLSRFCVTMMVSAASISYFFIWVSFSSVSEFWLPYSFFHI